MISETAVLLVCVCAHACVCAPLSVDVSPTLPPDPVLGAGKVSNHIFLLSTGGNLNWLGQENLQMPEGWW